MDRLKAVRHKDPVLGELSVHELVMKRLEQVSEPTVLFDPFTGPIKDQKGALRVKPGQRADLKTLLSIDWFAENVVGELPKR